MKEMQNWVKGGRLLTFREEEEGGTGLIFTHLNRWPGMQWL